MDKWKRYTGEEILYNALDENGVVSNEPMLEDAVKLGISTSSNGECILLKFYWTDGFGWYFKDGKITFILHECKVGDSVVGRTMRGYKTCLKKALLQDIGYYFKIKNYQYTKFSKKLKDLAEEFGYTDINKFIIDHFGMFLITTPKFVCHATMTENIKRLINTLEDSISKATSSPSEYWGDKTSNMKQIMLDFDADDLPFEMMPDRVDLADTGEILNSILKGEINGIDD